MPFTCDYPDPRGTGSFPEAFCVVAELNLCYTGRYGRVAVMVYADRAAHDAGRQPVDQVSWSLSADGTPEVPPTAWQPGVPALPPFDEFVSTPVPAEVVSGTLVPGQTPVWEVDQAIVFERIIKGRPPFHEAVVVAGSPRGL